MFLVNSENRDKNIDGLPGSVGLSPEYLPSIVKLAHASSLKVYAHVDTAKDLQIAFDSGVDGLAHMPGYGLGDGDPIPFSLNLKQAKGGKGRIVQPTLGLAASYSKRNFEVAKMVQKKNIALLKSAGALFVVGSDDFYKTQIGEVQTWQDYGFSKLDTFRSLTAFTPESIFPNRAIGKIEEGFEANFLILGENPLENPERMFTPQSVFKQGLEIYHRNP